MACMFYFAHCMNIIFKELHTNHYLSHIFIYVYESNRLAKFWTFLNLRSS